MFVLWYLGHVEYTEHYVIILMDIDGVRTSWLIFLVHVSSDTSFFMYNIYLTPPDDRIWFIFGIINILTFVASSLIYGSRI